MGNTVEPVDVYELPAHWRSFIMDGDKSGMTDSEVELAIAEMDNIFDAGHILVDVIGEPFFERSPAWKRWSGSDKVIAGMVYEYVAVRHRW